MYYTVYETTCLINGKKYIGVHKTENPDDDYLGSGRYITRAINKYGKENFRKKIFFIFDNPEQMFEKEKELVTEEFIKQRSNYNCKPGGTANFYYINNRKMNHKSNQHLIHGNRIKNDTEYAKKFSDKIKATWSSDKKQFQSSKMMGNGNHRKNTKWMSNDKESISLMVSISEVNEYLNSGWVFGLKYRKKRRSIKNSVFCYNPITKEKKVCKLHEIPDGWIRGFLPKNKKSAVG
jgi:hypothetical protein